MTTSKQTMPVNTAWQFTMANCSGPNRRLKILHPVTARSVWQVRSATCKGELLLPRVWNPFFVPAFCWQPFNVTNAALEGSLRSRAQGLGLKPAAMPAAYTTIDRHEPLTLMYL